MLSLLYFSHRFGFEDPVAKHFADAFGSLQGVDLAKSKADAKGTLAERVAYAQQAKEKEFEESFMVTAKEAEEVRSLASKAKAGQARKGQGFSLGHGEDYDFSKLPAEALQRLEALYSSINTKALLQKASLRFKRWAMPCPTAWA